MTKCKLRDGKVVGDYCVPYFVAEVNSSHFGNINTAKKMVDAAKEAGCNCVKFQSWSAESLYSKSYYKENPIAKRIVTKFSLSPDELADMAEYCHNAGISFSSTPYSREEVDFLVEKCGVPFIKVASMELNNLEYLWYIAKKEIPIVLSTGMGEIDEIKKAVKTIEMAGNKDIILLHCVSIYPAAPDTVNLNNIIGLRREFPEYPIGFSDHTMGETAAIASVALGAALIEKHITLDSKKIGMDNQMAMEPDQLRSLVQDCISANMMLGSYDRNVSEQEYEQRKNMRRSVVAKKDLKVGDVLTPENIDYKRPGTGISPDQVSMVLGKKLKNNIEQDCLILWSDIES